jgi:hypothetical protein
VVGDFVSDVLNDILPSGRGGVLMLKVYIDRGARKDGQGVVSVAGALFWPFFYEQFLQGWQPFLDGWGAPAFHATDFYPGGGDYFWRERPRGTKDQERVDRFERDSRRLPGLIEPYVRKLFVVAFQKNEYETVAPLAWRQRFGDVNSIAAQMICQSVGFWADREKHEGEIAYFYETGDGPDDEQFHNALQRVFRVPERRRFARMASTPIGLEKGKARGLEVADFLSWHWNKYHAETRMAEGRPRELRKDIRALMEMLEMRQETIDVRLFTGDGLRDFLLSHGCTLGRPRIA